MANTPLTKQGGIGALSRSASYKAKKLYKAKKHTGVKAVAGAAAAKVKTIGGAGNGKTRTIAAKTKYYPTEDTPTPVKNNKHAGIAALRSTFTPGAVCILLAGPFRGKRVVFLKQLDSGLLLVTGPYGVNGVPLKRVDQTYVIGTSTTVSALCLPTTLFDLPALSPAWIDARVLGWVERGSGGEEQGRTY
jgi:large subunit ribosomal protein L6e